ncbi:MAG TPA: nuclear transport factor 2 family protein [Thermoleophilaceae bacterium]|nr:nuclear transport factor 2 family protein [Thermoleophilaceae bacterium]
MSNEAATASAPEAVIERFSQLLSEGDLDAMVELYEPDATFAPQPGAEVTGRDAIRDALAAFLAVKPRMTGTIEKVLCAGDTALVANRWTLSGTAPDGSPVEMASTSADVLRRRSDGSWGIVIDDPWGASP